MFADFSEWYWYSPQATRNGRPRTRPGVHVVRRRITLDRLAVNVDRACNAYREARFDRPGHSFSPEEYKVVTDKKSYIGDLLLSLQADLRELTRYETDRAALKFPRVPTYDQLVELRRRVKRMRAEA